MGKYFDLQASYGCAIHMYAKKKKKCSKTSNLSFAEHSYVGSPFTNEEWKRMAHDVMYTAATHAKRVHDVTDLVKMAALTAILTRHSNGMFLTV